MRSKFAAICLVAVLAYGTALQASTVSAIQERGAVLAFEEMAYDFGTVGYKGGPRTASFVFRNDGDAPLVITRTETSCTCLRVDYPRKPVMPGETGTVEITYKPGKETGPFNNNVKVHSNAATKYPAVLFVRGEVAEK